MSLGSFPLLTIDLFLQVDLLGQFISKKKFLFYQVVYSKTASVPKVEAVKSDNKDDDIDIDAI